MDDFFTFQTRKQIMIMNCMTNFFDWSNDPFDRIDSVPEQINKGLFWKHSSNWWIVMINDEIKKLHLLSIVNQHKWSNIKGTLMNLLYRDIVECCVERERTKQRREGSLENGSGCHWAISQKTHSTWWQFLWRRWQFPQCSIRRHQTPGSRIFHR